MKKTRRVALVTGAAIRIGQEIARFLVKDGWFVIVHYNSSSKEALRFVSDLGEQNAVSIKLNLFSAKEAEQIIPQIIKKHGSLELIINNAASFKNDNIENASLGSWDKNFNTNLRAPFLLAQSLHKNINGKANIINILDYCVFNPPTNFLTYCMSKAALSEMTKIMSIHLAPNIRMNGIALGAAMQGKKQSKENFDNSIKDSLLGVETSIEDICNTIDYILKAKSLTGEIISIDSGKRYVSTKFQ